MKKLRINFLSHLHPFHYHGGGEQYTARLINEGKSRGHDIRIISMKPNKTRLPSRLFRFRKPDIWILFDVFNVPEAKRHFPRSFIDQIISNERYILGQNAYGDICYLNALPCNGEIGNGQTCVINQKEYYGYFGNKSGWKDGYCPINDNRSLFNNALMNVFLSPLHASIFHKIYPETKEKSYILKPLIDVDLFTDMHQLRDIKYASYGGMSEAKGFYNIMKRFPDEEITLFGSNPSPLTIQHKYGNVVGRIPYEQMPAFLNRVENYVHMPRWPEPNGLIANQAKLCGCNLITNDHVGALTHDFDISDKSHYKNNATDFWEHIESALN